MLSDAFWRREYGGRAGAIGESLRLEGKPFEIVGVAPAGFSGLEVGYTFDVAVPLCADTRLRPLGSMPSSRQNWWLAAAARLPEGQSLASRNATVEAMSPALFRETLPPEFRPELAEKFLAFRLAAIDASRGVSKLRGTFTSPLLLLMGVTGLVLLIACVNRADLLLARMSHRQRELAVRLAVGASRARLARGVAVETSVLALTGTACGVLLSTPLGRWLVRALVRPDTPVHLDLRLNWPLLLAAGVLAVAVCAICAVAPALRAAAVPPAHALRDGLRSTSSAGTLWWRRALIVAEVALTFVLVVGAVLMARSLGQLQAAELGFDARGLVTTQVSMDDVQDWRGRRAPLSRALMEVEPAASLRTRGMEEIIDSTLVVERLLARLSLFFGGLALLLAGVGLYGVIAYDAARRQRDIGIRLALGSSRRGVVLNVVGQIGWLLGGGLFIGLTVSVPLARSAEGLLYGVTVRDLGTYAQAGVALAVVGVAAAWVPAWRASRLNPTSALRST